MSYNFTWENLEKELLALEAYGGELVLRVDVDFDIQATHILYRVINKFNLIATFFFRYYGPYNIFNPGIRGFIEDVMKRHTVGYHHDLKGSYAEGFGALRAITKNGDMPHTAHNPSAIMFDEPEWTDLFVSDSNWDHWKSYNNGKIIPDDHRSPKEHIEQDNPDKIQVLIHPETWHD